jgi:hypothetical protein
MFRHPILNSIGRTAVQQDASNPRRGPGGLAWLGVRNCSSNWRVKQPWRNWNHVELVRFLREAHAIQQILHTLVYRQLALPIRGNRIRSGLLLGMEMHGSRTRSS